MWLGNWNPAKDRETDKKEEQLFKEFLITKYERRQWYKSPAEVKREEAATKTEVVKAEPKLQPPPSTKVSLSHYLISVCLFEVLCRVNLIVVVQCGNVSVLPNPFGFT